MLRLIAVAVAAVIPFVGLNGVGQAQSAAEITGNVQAVDCQSGTLTLDANGDPNAVDTIYASDNTAVTVESSTVPFCTLEGYVGAPVTAWVFPYGPDGSALYATQIDVTGPAYVAPATQAAIAPLPIIGTVLGTVLLGGLLYLVANSANQYYLYPYYGAYYHHYHRAWYRPYTGYYPASAPIISVAEPIYGNVLGVVTVNNYQYLAVRDRDGQFRRYPYYGPYRSYYSQEYHVAPRPYWGGYASSVVRAPVAQGDAHWDAPRYTMQQIGRTVTSRPTPWSAPHRAGFPAPAAQPRPTYQRPQYQQPQPQPTYTRPQYQRPQYQQPQPQPTYTQPQYQRPQYQQPQPQPTYTQPQYQRPRYQQPQPQPTYTQPQNQRPQYQQPQPQPTYTRPQYQRPQYQQPQPQPTYTQPQNQRPQFQQPQPQPTYTRPQYQRPQYQQPQPQPTYTQPQNQRPQFQQPQPQPTYTRPQYQQPQPQPTYTQPQNQRPQFQQPQPQPTYTRPQYQRPQYQQPQPQPTYTQPQNQRPQYQQPQPRYNQPQYQRPPFQQPQAPVRQDNGRGNGGGGRGQQCDPRSNQQCNNGNNR